MTPAPTTQVYQVFIRATAQQVWDTITRPEFTERYFYGTEHWSTSTTQYCDFAGSKHERC